MTFGGHTFKHILTGKAYTGPVRGHFLVYLALNSILLEYLKCPLSYYTEGDGTAPLVAVNDVTASTLAGSMNAIVIANLESFYDSTLENKINVMDDTLLQLQSLVFAEKQLEELKHILSEHCQTARRWIEVH